MDPEEFQRFALAAVQGGRKVRVIARRFRPIALQGSVDPQARDAAVRMEVQSQVTKDAG